MLCLLTLYALSNLYVDILFMSFVCIIFIKLICWSNINHGFMFIDFICLSYILVSCLSILYVYLVHKYNFYQFCM